MIQYIPPNNRFTSGSDGNRGHSINDFFADTYAHSVPIQPFRNTRCPSQTHSICVFSADCDQNVTRE